MAEVTYNDGPIRATWIVVDNDSRSRVFRVRDDAGAVVADPDGDGWSFFGQVRDVRGGLVVGDLTFAFNGEYVTQTLPDAADAAGSPYWWEKQVTEPGGRTRTIEAGPLLVLVDSAVVTP